MPGSCGDELDTRLSVSPLHQREPLPHKTEDHGAAFSRALPVDAVLFPGLPVALVVGRVQVGVGARQ
jgi:hypothetical protein